MKSFSVIVIGKNEEAHLDACLRSVQTAVQEIGNAEIVYVDSASTDRSVEIARSLGVRVLSLPSNCKHTPAAGRYFGFHNTSGDLLMFVDGDCVIEPQWLSCAIAYFTEPEVAGIAGFLNDLDQQGNAIPFIGERSRVVKPLTTLRGIAAYRRAALEQVGSFNPHLRSEEEAELALRLRKAGWQLLHIPYQMGFHQRGIPQLQAMWRNVALGRVSGVGLTWRYACLQGQGWQFCREQLRTTMLFSLIVLLLSPGLLLAALGYFSYALPFLVLATLWMLSVVVKKRSLKGPFEYAGTHLLILFGLLSGLFINELPAADAYPRHVLDRGPAPQQGATPTELQIASALPR